MLVRGLVGMWSSGFVLDIVSGPGFRLGCLDCMDFVDEWHAEQW